MTTLIAYATKHGCAEKVAKILADGIEGKVDLLNLKEKKDVDFSKYNKVVIGGSIHSGKINMLVKSFAIENKNELLNKKRGFYICYMDNESKAKQYMDESFPEVLLENSFAIGYFGGEINFEKLDNIDKMLIQKIAGINENISEINYDNIAQFINLANCHKKKMPVLEIKSDKTSKNKHK